MKSSLIFRYWIKYDSLNFESKTNSDWLNPFGLVNQNLCFFQVKKIPLYYEHSQNWLVNPSLVCLTVHKKSTIKNLKKSTKKKLTDIINISKPTILKNAFYFNPLLHRYSF